MYMYVVITILSIALLHLLMVWMHRSMMMPRHQEHFASKAEIPVTELIQDRQNTFNFQKASFPYLDQFVKRMKQLLKNKNKQLEEIKRYMKDHQKNVNFLKKMNAPKSIKAIYSQKDVENAELEIKNLKEFYQEHLRQYLALSNLNNGLLVQHLYCQESEFPCPKIEKNSLNSVTRYHNQKTKFNEDLAKAIDGGDGEN